MANSVSRSGVLAWPRSSVRPHESLWSLMHRFLWLNAPNWHDLERSFGRPTVQPFSLIYGSRILSEQDPGRRSFDQSRMASTLGLPIQSWWKYSLGWLRSTPADDIVPDMRFCPECLRDGYQTVVFQLACVQTCPIHGVPLIRGCPDCGHAISSELDHHAVSKPYMCPHCGHMLAPSTSLINPPRVDGKRISQILCWYRTLSTLAIVVSRPSKEVKDFGAYSAPRRYACLEVLSGHPAPEAVALDHKEIGAGLSAFARCGICLTPTEHRHNNDDVGSRRLASIYKAYRRHMQKAMPRGTRRLMQAYLDGHRALWIPAASVTERDKRAAAYGLLLFRCQMENWSDIFCYNDTTYNHRKIPAPSFSVRGLSYLRLFYSRRLHLNSAECYWLLDHLFFEELRALSHETLYWAQSMASIGRYWPSKELSWGVTQPYAIAYRRHDALTFWSWGTVAPMLGSNQDLETQFSFPKRRTADKEWCEIRT